MYDEDMPAFDPEPLDEDPEVNPDEGDGPDYDLAYDLWKEDQLRPPEPTNGDYAEYEVTLPARPGRPEALTTIVCALTTKDAARVARSRFAASTAAEVFVTAL